MLERTFRNKKYAWMVGIAVSGASLVSMAQAERDQALRFSPKLTTDHHVCGRS